MEPSSKLVSNLQPVGSTHLDITGLYYEVKNQNNAIETQIKNMGEVYSTDNQVINYKIEQTEYLHNINVILLYLYFLLLIILIIYLTIMPKSNLYVQVGLVITLVMYPFIIYFIEKRLYLLFLYLYSMLNGNPYMIIE